MTHKNTAQRQRLIRDIVAQHYEPGRHDRCKLWVFRNVVSRSYPMSERTFFRCLGSAGDDEKVAQLRLFD